MSIKIKLTEYKCHSTVYNSGTSELRESQEMEAKIGPIPFRLFDNCFITEVNPSEIKIQRRDETYILTPGNRVVISVHIDGDEWSDGCVYDWTNYSLIIDWPSAPQVQSPDSPSL